MFDAIIKWLADTLGIWLINYAHPDQAAKIKEIFATRDAQAVKDTQTKGEAAAIETQVAAREGEVDADQAVVAQNVVEVKQAEDTAAEKLKEVERAQSIEEVLNIKP